MSRRITLRDVAQKAGVALSTASMALRNNPELTRKTCAHVQGVARELGYKPDALLSALSAYRSPKKAGSDHGTIAFIINWKKGDDWKTIPFLRAFWEGGVQQANQLGYQLEAFVPSEEELTGKQLSRILYSRGIRGIVITPMSVPVGHLRMDWSKFAVVAVKGALATPEFDFVATDNFRGTQVACRHLRKLGYKRIGLCVHRGWDRYSGFQHLAGHWLHHEVDRDLSRTQNYLPPFRGDVLSTKGWKSFQAWFHRHRPDVLLAAGYEFNTMRKRGLKIPQEVGFAGLDIHGNEPPVAGMQGHGDKLGAAAVKQLHSSFQAGRYGIPELPEGISIVPSWIHRPTVREAAVSAPSLKLSSKR